MVNLSDRDAVIDAYCAAWDEPDAATRERRLAAIWAEGGVYTDPTVDLAGLDALSAHIATVQAKLPGSRLERTTGLDDHHDVARFGWRKVLADGTPLAESLDLVVFDPDGRLRRVVGFFGMLR